MNIFIFKGGKDWKLTFLFLDILEDVSLEGELDGDKIRLFLVIFIVRFYLLGHLY